MKKYLNILNTIDPQKHIHASNYILKFKNYQKFNASEQQALNHLLPEYLNFYKKNHEISGYGNAEIISRTTALNTYFDFISSNGYDNMFTAQSKFRPTIMEEFMFILFNDLIKDVKIQINDTADLLKIGGTKAYTNLYFSATNLKGFIDDPQIGVNQKDQDFAIYRPISINIENSVNIKANLPVVAIENKTYIDKTMLEGSIATAEKIKSGNPYSLFIIVTETYDVDLNVDPAYSRIDQIYVLRKGKRKNNNNPIFSDVIIDLAENIKSHLIRNWSDIEQKMTNLGKII